MSGTLREITIVRHGETEWTKSRKHTGRTDIPLTPAGEAAARKLGDRLGGKMFSTVWSSPSSRASATCALAGFEARRGIDPDLAEWDYGAYEGLTTREILETRPDWSLFRDGCPDGEGAADVGSRADSIIGRIAWTDGNVLIFSSAHVLRVLAARWLGLPPERGASFVLDTASISILGYEHDPSKPVIRAWNET